MAIPKFVRKNNKIDIIVYIYELNDNIEATHDKNELPEDVETETITFNFRRPNYADSNVILRQFQMSGDSVDIAALQDIAMNNLLVDWDCVDDNGDKMSVNRGNIDSLEPAIGRAAALGYLAKIRF